MSAQPQLVPMSHPDMVKMLAKTGEDIIITLRPGAAHNWHMATGVVGEIGELIAAYENQDFVNMREEHGDVEFYLEGLRQGAGIERAEEWEPVRGGTSFMLTELAKAGSALIDAVKKEAIYNQRLDSSEVIQALVRIDRLLAGLMETVGLTRGECLEHNILKLEKRYAGFHYSDQAAQGRADKI